MTLWKQTTVHCKTVGGDFKAIVMNNPKVIEYKREYQQIKDHVRKKQANQEKKNNETGENVRENYENDFIPDDESSIAEETNPPNINSFEAIEYEDLLNQALNPEQVVTDSQVKDYVDSLNPAQVVRKKAIVQKKKMTKIVKKLLTIC